VHQGGLAVHVGHVGKAALRQGQAAVLPTGDQLLRQRQGQRVLRKGAGRVAPGKQLTPRRCLQRGPETGADGFVQGGVFGEVVLWGEFGEPEIEDGLVCHLERLNRKING
jgi:hypothetical protein